MHTGDVRSEWHVITCEYPPAVGGVSDYSRTLAAVLAQRRPVHVWCPADTAAPPSDDGVSVHAVPGAFSPSGLWRIGTELDARPRPHHLFVQWVPQGYGYRSLNVWLPLWLLWRAAIHGDDVHVMVHEPFLPWSSNPRRMFGALVHRLMLWLALRRASHVWLSTATWKTRISRYVPERTPVEWLPVPAPQLRTGARPGASIRRMHAEKPLVGHFGTHAPLVTRMLEAALGVVLERSNADILLVGRDSDTFRAQFLEPRPQYSERVHATGTLPLDQVAAHLDRCDVMLQPYPDGITSRRTSTLGLLASGLPVVTNTGHLSEPFWADSKALLLVPGPDPLRIGEAAVRLLSDDTRRRELVGRGREMYELLFAPRHAVRRLDAAAWPDPAARIA